MASRDDLFDPMTLGVDDPGEDVLLMRSQSGRALLVPQSISRLGSDAADVVADLQQAALAVAEAQLRVAALVHEARLLGVSWNAIGWSVGMTGQSARERWREEVPEVEPEPLKPAKRAPRKRR